MIFLSQILNKPIIDDMQEQIGRVSDVIATEKDSGGYPRVTGIVFMKRGKQYVIPYQCIENLGYGEVTLSKTGCWKNDYQMEASEFMLRRDVLDEQIFDIGGIRVVRVNDLELVKVENKVSLIGIDISTRALFRRLGMENLPLIKHSKSTYIDWSNVSLVKGQFGNVQLKTSKEKLHKLHPADIANMIESLNFHESTKLVQSLDKEKAAEVLEEVEPAYKDTLLERFNPLKLASIVEEMPADEAADIIQNLSDHKRMQVFRRLGVRKAKMLHRLTRYKEDTAGGLMNTDFMAVHKDMTVHEAIKKVRINSEQHASIYHIFTVDEENHLEGIVSIRTLLLAEKHEKISDMMTSVYHTVRVTTSGEEVARVMTKYNLLSIAVVDRNKVIRGIITVDDILRFLIPDA